VGAAIVGEDLVGLCRAIVRLHPNSR
jgi:hypothetical protein